MTTKFEIKLPDRSIFKSMSSVSERSPKMQDVHSNMSEATFFFDPYSTLDAKVISGLVCSGRVIGDLSSNSPSSLHLFSHNSL